MHAQDELHLREYLEVLKRRRLLLTVTIASFLIAALVWTLVLTPLYRSTAEVLLADSLSESILQPESGGGGSANASRSRVQTEIRVMESRSVRDAVEKVLGFTPKVSIKERGDSDVVGVSATNADPERAAKVAQTYAEVYVDTRRQTRIDQLLEAGTRVQTQIDDAHPPGRRDPGPPCRSGLPHRCHSWTTSRRSCRTSAIRSHRASTSR